MDETSDTNSAIFSQLKACGKVVGGGHSLREDRVRRKEPALIGQSVKPAGVHLRKCLSLEPAPHDPS